MPSSSDSSPTLFKKLKRNFPTFRRQSNDNVTSSISTNVDDASSSEWMSRDDKSSASCANVGKRKRIRFVSSSESERDSPVFHRQKISKTNGWCDDGGSRMSVKIIVSSDEEGVDKSKNDHVRKNSDRRSNGDSSTPDLSPVNSDKEEDADNHVPVMRNGKTSSKKGVMYDSDDDGETSIKGDDRTSRNADDEEASSNSDNTDTKFERKTNYKKTIVKKTKKRLKRIAYQDSDESADDGSNSDDEHLVQEDVYDSDDSTKNRKKPTFLQQNILTFFNDATKEELICVPSCSKPKSELIFNSRPFTSWKNLISKLDNTKTLSTDMIDGVKTVLNMRSMITTLLQRCEAISSEMGSLVSELMEGKSNASHLKKQPSSLNPDLKLASYQLLGLNWLVLLHRKKLNGILADEMGLGKTIQAIALLAHLYNEGIHGPHIIIVPSSTLDNWVRELSVWCKDLNVLVYHGSLDERYVIRRNLKKGREQFDVMVTTYNIVMNNEEDRGIIKSIRFEYAIFDEAHMLKNMKTLRYKNLMKIRPKHRLLLTGTPLQNNLLELISLLTFVMPQLFDEHLGQVMNIFSTVMKHSTDSRSSFDKERIEQAKQLMKPFVLRRLKSQVLQEMPLKHEQVDHIDLTDSQKIIYDNLVSNFSKRMKEGRDGKGLPENGAGMMIQLRKAANHPLLMRNKYSDKELRVMAKKMLKEPTHRDANSDFIFEDMQVMHDFELHQLCSKYKVLNSFELPPSDICDSGKFLHLDTLLEAHKSQGNRVLLFSQFVMMLDIIEEYLQIRGHAFVRLDGQTPVQERQDLIDLYSNDESIFVFLLSTRAGGLGINLTAANVVILHDIDFNPYNDKQAEDRCHRVGQKRDVHVIRLISKNTIEEGMLKCAISKLKLEKDLTAPEDDCDETNSGDVIRLLQVALGME